MSDQRSAIAEFRELEQRRLAGGLTSTEVARYDWLRRVLGAGAASSPPGAGFDMGAAATDLHESLQPAGLRGGPAAPASAPAPEHLVDALWTELTSQGAAPPAAFPDDGFDPAWLSEDPEHGAAAPPVRPQAWNPAAPGYDPEAPYDEAAWIAAGYDPNVTYDWSAYGAQAEEAHLASPGPAETAPAIPLPSSQVPAPELLAEEDLPTLDVLPADELPAAGDPGPVEAALPAVAAVPITDAFLEPELAPVPPAAPARPEPLLPAATPGEDQGWPGLGPDAEPPPVEPAPAWSGKGASLLGELLPPVPPPPPAAEAAPAGEGAVFDDLLTEDGLLSDEELRLLASGGAISEPAPSPMVPLEPVPAGPPEPPLEAAPEPPPEELPIELLEIEAEAVAVAPEPLQPEEVPEELVQSWGAEPLFETAAPPHDALPPLPLAGLNEAEIELPRLTLEPAVPVQPAPPLVGEPSITQPAPPPQAEPEPHHPPLPEAIQANVFVPPRPVFAMPVPSVTPAPLRSPPAEPAPAPAFEPPLAPAAGPETEAVPAAHLPEPPPEVPEPEPPAAALAAQAAPPEAPARRTLRAIRAEPALPEVLLPPQADHAEPSVALDFSAPREGWRREPVFAGAPPAVLSTPPASAPAPAPPPIPALEPAPAHAFAPPAWPPHDPALELRATPAGFGAYDESAAGHPASLAGGAPADPLSGAWDAGGEPTFDPAIQPYEPAPPGAPRGEYDDLPGPAGRGLESMLPFDPAVAAAIPPGSVPEGYESGPPPEPSGSMELELPGRPVAPAEVGPVAELSEVSAEWQPDATLARGFDLASDGSFGLPELSLGETPSWPPPPPPGEPPIALAPPAEPTPAAVPHLPPSGPAGPPLAPGEEVLEELDADELIEQEPLEAEPAPRSPASPAAPATPVAPAPPATTFVAPAAGLFAAAGAGWRTTPTASAPPRTDPVFVAPTADLYARTPATTAPAVVPPVQAPPPPQAAAPPAAPPPALPPPVQAAPPAAPSVRWSVPAAPIVPRLKATPPLAPAPAAPELDLEPLPPLVPTTRVVGSHRVLVHTIDGEVKRGVLESPSLDGDRLTLRPLGPGAPLELSTSAVKAVFFLLGPGEKPPGPEGRKVRVTFRDGRQVVGYSPDYQEGEIGFLLIPVESRTTTARIWVYQASVRQVAIG